MKMRLEKTGKNDEAKRFSSLKKISFFIACVSAFCFMSCRKNTVTDLRALAPAESLIYMETKDLGGMMKSLTEREIFKKNSKTIPNFSALENMQAAVVITGFQTSAKDLSDESASLNFKPQFALIADTHAWEGANLSLAENQIGAFAKDVYGDDVRAEKTENQGAKIFTWTSKDDRQLFAAVVSNLVYVSNSESVLEKCLAAKRGESENMLGNEDLARAREADGQEKLAYGFITEDGVGQLGNVFGTMTAAEAAGENTARNFIAENLPKLIRGSAKSISWTTVKTDKGIEDKYYINPEKEVYSVLKETVAPAEEKDFRGSDFVPTAFVSVTNYSLKNPELARQSAVSVLGKKLEGTNAEVLKIFAGGLLDSFGIENIETFLAASGKNFMTARFDSEGEKEVLIAEVKDAGKIKTAFGKEFDFKSAPEKTEKAAVWKSADGEFAAAFAENYLIAGDPESVLNCVKANETKENLTKLPQFLQIKANNAVAVTVTKDSTSAPKLIDILGEENGKNEHESFYVTETKLTPNGIERRTVSDFGMIGEIVEKFDENN